MDFDRPAFEQTMGEAVQLHNDGKYEASLGLRLQALI